MLNIKASGLSNEEYFDKNWHGGTYAELVAMFNEHAPWANFSARFYREENGKPVHMSRNTVAYWRKIVINEGKLDVTN